nr:MAG TPA: hypothetical protein [Caudoviricetes sp.]
MLCNARISLQVAIVLYVGIEPTFRPSTANQ